MGENVDVSELLDRRGISAFNIRLLVFGFLVVLFDGYDITAIGFAAPHIMRAWNITDQAAFGPALGASLVGMLIGAPLLGFMGDRLGRRWAIILSCLIFGVFTWLVAFSSTLTHLVILRLLAGIGIGGLMPNIIALTAEFAPRRFRATLIIIMFSGVAFGGGLPGAVSAALVPRYGWPVLFTIGGTIPVLVAILCLFWLPESIKYLAVRGGRQQEAIRLLSILAPDRRFDSDTQLTIHDEKQVKDFSPRHLFADGLGLITPLLWFLFIVNLMGYFFLVSWTPYLLTSAHLPMDKAAIATALFQFGGAVGGWALCRPMDRLGLMPMTVLFIIAVPAVALIGILGAISVPLLMITEFIGGFCVLGLQFGLNALSALIYPTSYRSNGSGWALGVGRFGSIIGPVLGGVLISLHLPVSTLYALAALPFLAGAIACFFLARLYVARFQGTGLGERDAYPRTVSSR